MKWRILDIDWHHTYALRRKAEQLVSVIFGPAIPLPIWRMLQRAEYRRIIRGFTVLP